MSGAEWRLVVVAWTALAMFRLPARAVLFASGPAAPRIGVSLERTHPWLGVSSRCSVEA